jgi:hypothetical protein
MAYILAVLLSMNRWAHRFHKETSWCKVLGLVGPPQESAVSCSASSGLASSNADDAWHFEVEGLPSISQEFVF